MKHLIVAGLLLITFASVQEAHTLAGTCASIGYSTACCPPDHDGSCEASDGDCFCGSDCHVFGDCCDDVHCPANPRMCRDIGITSCCSDATGNGLCDVNYRNTQGKCSCNVTCHLRDDCCSDAESFCIPRTCTEAGKHNGCCIWSSPMSCFVPGGRCYCDSYCNLYNDCCTDVSPNISYQVCVSFPTVPEPVTTAPTTATTDTTFTACAVADVINLTSTITDEDYVLWPNEEVVFTCETRGLVNEWTSDDYLGQSISLIFDSNNNIGDEVQSQTASRSKVKLIRIDYNYVMVSQLHISTLSQFPTSTVACTNVNGISKNITFSVLACSQPTPQDGIVIPHIQTSQRNDPIIFRCKDGHHPTEELSTLCLQNGTWTMDPNHVCSDIDECSENEATTTCPSGSRCINTRGSYTCVCNEGYFHLQTENLNICEDVDECTFSGMNICDDSSRADCVNTQGSYTCACKTGYKGNGQICKLFDDGTCDTVCDHHCVHQRNAPPRCVCDRGYYLTQDGITCIDVNECLVPTYSSLCINAQCRNTNGSFVCICDPGYIADGKYNCVDIDECEDGSHSCNLNANCTNTEGNYFCTCHESFYNNGTTCLRGISPKIKHTSMQVKPNHELEYNIGTDFCVEDPVSMGFYSSITCELIETALPPPEFLWNVTLNGTELSNISRNVDIENDTLTLTGPIQLDNTSTLDVVCDVSNIFGSNSATTTISLCSPTQCQDGVTNNCTQVCTRDANTGVHRCSCYPGYQVDADHDTECSDIEECANGLDNCSSPNWKCKNLMPPEMFMCECNLGFTGDNCEDINECESDNSHHCPLSSICVNTYGSYDCVCVNNTKEDVSGNCTDIDECSEGKHNCSKYAKCKNSFGEYSCECLPGFKGDGEICTISEEVIIGTSVSGGLLLVGIFLLLIITGSIKIGRRLRNIIQSNKAQHQILRDIHDHEMNVVHGIANEVSIDNEDQPGGHMVVRDSLKSKLPQSLVIKSANLRVLDPIGQGEFGIVYKGCLVGQHTDEIVAIKTLKGFIDASAIQELLSECAKMKNFANLHVMSLKGVCLDGGPVPYIVLPYMANGSLASYLKKERKNLVVIKDNTSNVANDSEIQPQALFIRKRLMDMCLQVAKGMEYLASQKVVHRDLAARNCMIDFNMVIKVADFGMSVNIGAKEYYRLTKHVDVKLPVKWMAPECLSDFMFSEMSDVWSYGITCWEIFTGGQAPYSGVRPSALLSFLQRGERLEMPNNSACNDDLYSMMWGCWKMEPDKRPSFSTLVNILSKSLEKQAGYLDIGDFTTGNNCDTSTDHSCASLNEELNVD